MLLLHRHLRLLLTLQVVTLILQAATVSSPGRLRCAPWSIAQNDWILFTRLTLYCLYPCLVSYGLREWKLHTKAYSWLAGHIPRSGELVIPISSWRKREVCAPGDLLKRKESLWLMSRIMKLAAKTSTGVPDCAFPNTTSKVAGCPCTFACPAATHLLTVSLQPSDGQSFTQHSHSSTEQAMNFSSCEEPRRT